MKTKWLIAAIALILMLIAVKKCAPDQEYATNVEPLVFYALPEVPQELDRTKSYEDVLWMKDKCWIVGDIHAAHYVVAATHEATTVLTDDGLGLRFPKGEIMTMGRPWPQKPTIIERDIQDPQVVEILEKCPSMRRTVTGDSIKLALIGL